jgi:hypothetical protein
MKKHYYSIKETNNEIIFLKGEAMKNFSNKCEFFNIYSNFLEFNSNFSQLNWKFSK